MSASINRSLTTVRTELEFLLESNVLTQSLYDHILTSLPTKYAQGMPPADLSSTTKSTTQAQAQAAPLPPAASSSSSSQTGEYAEALFDYKAQQPEDLELKAGSKIVIQEKLSDSWWKGTSNGKTGIFPSNYVKIIGGGPSIPEKQEPPATNVYYQQQPQQPMYGGAPPTYGAPQQQQYYEQPPQQQQYTPMTVAQGEPQKQQHHVPGGVKKFGKKLGDATIFGAGATIGSNIINSIF